jgi:plastocyanin
LGLIVLLLVLGSAFVVACGGDEETSTTGGTTATTGTGSTSGGNGQPEEVQVVIEDYTYVPGDVTIQAGGSVTWTNQDSVQHNAGADDGSFEGPLLSRGESFTQVFDTPGTYPYHCTPHPYMKATVTVE